MNMIAKNKKMWVLMVSIIFISISLFYFMPSKMKASGKMIVINPGHMDGVDPGAVNSNNGIREVDLNNALAIKTVATLRAGGYNAMLSHPIPGNKGLPVLLANTPDYGSYTKSICDAANSKKADLLLSIHHNSEEKDSSGYELYWSSYHPTVDNDGIYEVPGLWSGGEMADLDKTPSAIALTSKALAEKLSKNFENLDYVPPRWKSVFERDDAITRRTSMPSVLIEAGFVSNDTESSKMADGKNQQKMADQILKSVNEIFPGGGTPDPPIDPLEPMKAKTMVVNKEKDNNTEFVLTTGGITYAGGVNGVSYEVWNEKAGRGTAHWYGGETKDNGASYTSKVNIKEFHHSEKGKYIINIFGKDSQDNHYLLGTKEVMMEPTEMKAKSVINNGSPTEWVDFSVSTKGLTSNNGINGLSYAVTSLSNGVTEWYAATTNDNGETYSATIPIYKHHNVTGTYVITAFGKDRDDLHLNVGKTEVVVTQSVTAEFIEFTENPTTNNWFTITTGGLASTKGINGVSYEAWNEKAGRETAQWVAGETKDNGKTYTSSINIKDHNNAVGKYNVVVYGKNSSNTHYVLGIKEVMVHGTQMSANSVTNSGSPTNQENFTVSTNGLVSNNGINGLSYAVTSSSNGITQWYAGETKDNGLTYTATIPTSLHNNATGSYVATAFGKDKNDLHIIVGSTEVIVNDGVIAKRIEVNENPTGNTWFTMTTGEISSATGFNGISYEVWNESAGRGAAYWYGGVSQDNGATYVSTIDIKNHGDAKGKYIVYVYGKNGKDVHYLVGMKEVMVSSVQMSAESVTNSGSPTGLGSFTVSTNGLTSNNGINGLSYAVTSEKNGETKWYDGITKDGGATYFAEIETALHHNATGKYVATAFGKDQNNFHQVVGSTTVEVVADGALIMGETTVNAQQLIDYYLSTGAVFPEYYIARGVDLPIFVGMYMKEAQIEGVRAEVAFAQMLLETGNLQFGGDVKVDQFNFAGLGAVGNGEPGFHFGEKYGDTAIGLQLGIRGHVQHLRCYGTDEPTVQENVDPRWFNVSRPRSTTVEGLSGSWAADPNYAPKLLKIMSKF